MKKQWCIPTVGAEFVWRMEDVLDLYARPYNPREPVVCFDETSAQLVAETRAPLPIAPGRPACVDYEYERRGTANVFLAVEPHAGWRHVEVTAQRTKQDFARQMRALVEVRYPEATMVHVVLDNLNTHSPASLYEAFPPAEAKRVLDRLAFHYTPKHGSWLNMVEIEFALLARQCLRRRLGDRDTLACEVAARQVGRNRQRAHIHWGFTVDDARAKLKRLYPSPAAI